MNNCKFRLNDKSKKNIENNTKILFSEIIKNDHEYVDKKIEGKIKKILKIKIIKDIRLM